MAEESEIEVAAVPSESLTPALKTIIEELREELINVKSEMKQLTANQEVASRTNDGSDIEKNSADSQSKGDKRDKDVKHRLFTQSTHRYLFMDTIKRSDCTSYKVRWNHIIIASSIIIFQFFAYSVFLYFTYYENKKGWEDRMSPTLEIINAKYCYNADKYNDDSVSKEHYQASIEGNAYNNLAQGTIDVESLPLDLMKCSNPNDNYHTEQDKIKGFVVGLTAGFLLAFFLLSDLYEGFILLTKTQSWRARFVGLLILFKAIFASAVGCITFTNVPFTGLSESFLLIVGLVFIHDVDERFKYMEEIIEQTREENFCFCRITISATTQFGFFWWMLYLPIILSIYGFYCNNLIEIFSFPLLESIVVLAAGAGFYAACAIVLSIVTENELKGTAI